MTIEKNALPTRKSVRLRNYDYSTPGAYFITICTYNRNNIFGDIVRQNDFERPKIFLSKIGEIAKSEILKIERHYQNIKIDKYTIMPNHIHLIVCITERINPFPTMIKYDIPNVIGKYKAAVTRNVGKAFMPSERNRIWQTSFNDHIIRGEEDYLEIWRYIDENPAKWCEDCFFSCE